ncbi:MAG: cellulose binding domain-containing protein [Clostridiales bacterium]|nr:cellulose binding domain-containing protein [Clostridiales bacterium]
MLRERWLKVSCLILSISFVLSCIPFALRAQGQDAECFSVIEDLDFEVDASISSFWDSHANLEFVITNTGDDTIHNWFLTFDLPYSIEGIWGAQVFETGSGVYTIKNVGWNQDILPENSITFGMTVSSLNGTPIADLPSYYLLNTKITLVDPSCYTVSYQEYSNWGTGFNGALLIENDSFETIEDWELCFSCSQTITEVAAAEVVFEDDLYTISNNGSNQNLMPYSTTSLTVVGSCNGEGSSFILDNLELYSVGYAFGLTEDIDQNGIADYIDFMNGQSGEEDITPTPTITLIPTINPTQTITEEPTPIPELDSDGDGIPDSVEAELGTDPNSPDSDNDGVNDSVEVMIGLDPLSGDSDGDGLPDGQEDADDDNLTLLEEIEYGTYTWTGDSDVDGILDGDEVHIYGTDPLDEDTDGDLIEDGDELKLGTDPLIPDSDGDGVPDGQERFLQTREEIINNPDRPEVNKVEVTLEGTGCLDTVMSIEDVYNKDKCSSELAGLVGVPVEIEYEGDFDEATLTFHYDQTMLTSASTNIPEELPIEDNYVTRPQTLGIFYYDEETGFYVDCEAEVDVSTQTVSCPTTHFSTYMLVDRAVWYYFWTAMKYSGEMRPSHEGYSGIDYVLEIPYIQSMTETDIAEMNAIAYEIIDNMQEGDRMVVQGYNTIGTYRYNYTSDKDLLKRQVSEWPWNEGDTWVGSSDSPDGLIGARLDALEIFNIAASTPGHDADNELVTIAFHNSTNIGCWFYSASHRTKTEMTAYIFTLSSGDPQTTELRWLNIASGGGVIDCEGKTSEEVFDEFASLYAKRQGEDLDPHTEDSGVGDGLWDIYEHQGMLSTSGRFYFAKSDKVDSDEDTVNDKDEMGICYLVEVDEENRVYINGEEPEEFTSLFSAAKIFQSFGEGKWTVYGVVSNPQSKDSDNDNCDDEIDAKPLKKNPLIDYIICENLDWFLETEALMRMNQKKTSKEFRAVEVSSIDQLVQVWNLMGENSDGKQEYSLDEVVLIIHGRFDSIGKHSPKLTKDEVAVGGISSTHYLERKRINTLVLSSCNGGDITKLTPQSAGGIKADDNMATAFASWESIGEVYAWNGTASYIIGVDEHIGIFDINYTIEHSFDVEKRLYEDSLITLFKVLVFSVAGKWGEVDKSLDAFFVDIHNLPQLGRVRYYRNKEGEIEYEKVSDISWSFSLAWYSS